MPKPTAPEPVIPTAVVEWLEGLLPNRLPTTTVTMEQIHVRIGEQNVIAKLRATMERQQSNPLQTV